MRYPFTQFIILSLILTVESTATAGDPKELVRACPRLAPINGVSAGDAVIDNETVLRLAKKGRIAAVTNRSDLPATTTSSTSTSVSPTKKKWRSEHRKLVSAVQRLQQQLNKAEGEIEALKSQFIAATKASQRARLRPRLESKEFQVDQIKKNLRRSLDSFSRLIREARQAGAQPGWFRDLPRP